MTGNIVYVNYELSSWQYMDDDKENDGQAKSISIVDPLPSRGYRVTKYGYVEGNASIGSAPVTKGDWIVKHTGYVVRLGAGSAYGGRWKPKKPEDERFFGEEEQLKTTYIKGNRYDTKMDMSGKAAKERHYTNHGNPKQHSDPHDHILVYNLDGSPDWVNSELINYFDGNIPEFKRFKEAKNMSDDRQYTYENLKKEGSLNPEHYERYRFESIAEFQAIMRSHAEVVFVYHKKVYSLTYIPGKIAFCEAYYDGDDDLFDTSEEVLNYVMDDGKKLREIITEIQVVERTL